MNRDQVAHWLEAEADGELDSASVQAMRRHLQDCAQCAARSAHVHRERALAALERPYARAVQLPPPAAHARSAASRTSAPARPVRHTAFWLGALAGALAVTTVWAMHTLWQWPGAHERLAAELVQLHTQATLSGARIALASSEQHVVKPWLTAQLDYAVPVKDHAAAGYPLVGTRIDRLGGQPVAVLVYRRRAHIIDVFVQPAAQAARADAFDPVRGFQLADAVGTQMRWTAVSDLNAKELRALVGALADGTVPAGDTPPAGG